jgi:signal peptidase I
MFGGDQNPFIHDAEGTKSNPFWTIVQAIVIALAINVTIYFLFILPSQVDGSSMIPTLIDKELLFANKIPTWLGNTDFGKQNNLDFQKGDIVIFEYEKLLLVKRVIGTAGDKVKISEGYVYVNGKKLNETYLTSDVRTYLPIDEVPTIQEGEEATVPENSYFCLGDNRPGSKDSRYGTIGFVKREKLKGVVFLRFWPMDKFSTFSRAIYN